MKTILRLIFLGSFFFIINGCKSKTEHQFVTTDIDNFWNAFDKIVVEDDSKKQLKILNEDFIEKASSGQKKMFRLRKYKPQEYIDAINDYPLFWNSIRANMNKAGSFANEISNGVNNFKKLYPKMNAANVYFTVGVFRSPGTTLDSDVLIGSEFAFGDLSTVTSEFESEKQYVVDYFKQDPIKNISFLNVHECVHTQQESATGENLLTQCLREGVAEFLAVKSMNVPSPSPAISFGQKNRNGVVKAFKSFMFNDDYSYWLWSIEENKFNQRDLGYFIGYDIAETFYNKSNQTLESLEKLIDLDYSNFRKVKSLIDESEYFELGIDALHAQSIADKPEVLKIEEFTNGDKSVDPSIEKITVHFSKPMNIERRGFELGPKGVDNVLRVEEFLGFSEDRKSMSVKVNLLPNTEYQLVLSEDFQDIDGNKLDPFLIDIQTKG